MKSHQIRMDVIGNNIANVNTVGFKRGRANFEDTLYQTIKSSSKTTNPAQAGLGTSLAGITSDMNSGALQSTGRALDLAINGDGFFRFSDPNKDFNDERNKLYGREGTLYIGNNGSIVNSNGMKLVAYQWNRASMEATGAPVMDLDGRIESAGSIELQRIKVDPNTLEVKETPVSPTVPIEIKVGMTIDDIVDAINAQTSNTGVVAGKTEVGGVEKLTLVAELNSLDGFRIDAITTTTGIDLGADLGLVAHNPLNVDDPSTYSGYEKDSYAQRPLEIDPDDIPVGSIKFEDNGTVSGFNNQGENLRWTDIAGISYDSTMIKLYTFPNQDGLERVDKNIFTLSPSSGKEQEGVSNTTGYGTIEAGYLEMSNVDLADEFSTMITTQRGYQASARMITISDTMLEELLNLKR